MELETPGPRPPPPPLTGGFWLSESTYPWFYPAFQDYSPLLQKCRNQLYVTSLRVNLGSEVPPPFFFNCRLSSLKGISEVFLMGL